MQGNQVLRDIALIWQRLEARPEKTLRVFVDLGLDDCEIGRYHAVPPAVVSALRTYCRITPADDVANKGASLIGEMDSNVYHAWLFRAQSAGRFLPRRGMQVSDAYRRHRSSAVGFCRAV